MKKPNLEIEVNGVGNSNYLSKIIIILFILSDLFAEKEFKIDKDFYLYLLQEDKSAKVLKEAPKKEIPRQETQKERENRIATEKWNKGQKILVAKEMKRQTKNWEKNQQRLRECEIDMARDAKILEERDIHFLKDVKDGKASYRNRAKWEKDNPYREDERKWDDNNPLFLHDKEEWAKRNLFLVNKTKNCNYFYFNY